MPNPSLISIIIPVYNRLDCLQRSIDSVLKQTTSDWELIVVDDGSQENIASFVHEIQQRASQPVTYLRQDNQGPGIARRNGLAVARGKYIQYLDSDDEMLPEKLSRQVAMLEADPQAVMCYTPTITGGTNGQEMLRKFSDQYEPDLLKGALEWRRWHTSSCLWRYPDKEMAYWSQYYNGEDVLHDVSVGVHTRKVVFIAEPLVITHQGSSQVSAHSNNPENRSRLITSLYHVRLEAYRFLVENQLDQQKQYCDPLSERFFHGGLQLLKKHALRKGLVLLGYSIKTSRYATRTLFAMGGILLGITTLTAFPQVFSKYFKVYRKIAPEFIHFRRTF